MPNQVQGKVFSRVPLKMSKEQSILFQGESYLIFYLDIFLRDPWDKQIHFEILKLAHL